MKRILAVLLAALLLPVYALADSENTVVRVGVTGAFYDDLWQPAIEELAKEGITVETVQFSDFSLPNNALNSGDIELNAFQHHAYFNNDTTTNGYDLSVLADTFVITMNLYSEKYDTIEEPPPRAASPPWLCLTTPPTMAARCWYCATRVCWSWASMRALPSRKTSPPPRLSCTR